MRDSYKRVLALLGVQAGAFVLVLLVGGFANFGTVSPPAPVTKTVIKPGPAKTVIKVVTPAPSVSTITVTAAPTTKNPPSGNGGGQPGPSTAAPDGVPGQAPSGPAGGAGSSSAPAGNTAAHPATAGGGR
jgi:hypothetical protein